jgi:HSP20 family molecular chaperone IbpA
VSFLTKQNQIPPKHVITCRPSEVCVKTKNGRLIISAKHETPAKEDGEVACRYEMHREMAIPNGVEVKDIQSEYDADGVLHIQAPYNPPTESSEQKEKLLQKPQAIDVKHE